MNNSLELIKQIYKPYRLTIKNSAIILDTTEGKYIVKEKKKEDVNKIYNYLKSRNFDYFPKLIDDNREDVNIYEYIEDTSMPIEQKSSDMIDIVALLHSKTTYYKKVSEDKYKQIYEDILNNINYLKNYYINLFKNIDEEIYMSPSHYMLIRNSSKIMASLDFANSELEAWYEMVKKNNKQRVALIHNNLNLDHFRKNNKGYLISWDKAVMDTPVLDLVIFYKNEFINIDFETILEEYLKKSPFSEEEKKLFFILISILDEIKLDNIKLPIKCGDKVGVLRLKEGNKIVNSTYLTVKKDVKKANIMELYIRNIKNILVGSI